MNNIRIFVYCVIDSVFQWQIFALFGVLFLLLSHVFPSQPNNGFNATTQRLLHNNKNNGVKHYE